MKKGQVVKCVRVEEGVSYLTVGEKYTVVAGEGDKSLCIGDDEYTIPSDKGFNIISNRGVVVYALYPTCAHATWELVSE